MHSDGDWPPDDRDPDWPDDWPAPATPGPGARRRAPRIAALTLTALVALGAGACAVYVYQDGLPGSMPAASPSEGRPAEPSPGSQAGPVPGGGRVRAMLLLGPVRAVGRDTITVGGGTGHQVSAQVTSATQFSGSARSLAQVHGGDTVAVQITESNSVARVVSRQDQSSH